MHASTRVTTEFTTPHYTTLVLFLGVAAFVSWPSYQVGDQYVKKSYMIDDPFASSFGGYPAMAIAFGLVLQLGVDLMRLGRMRQFDQALGSVDRFVTQAVRRRLAPATAEHDNTRYQELAAAPHTTSLTLTVAGRARLETVKMVALRLATYAQVVATGMSAGLLPITFMYTSEEAFSETTDRMCLAGALSICALQVGSMVTAYRAQPPRVRASTDDDAADPEAESEAEQVEVMVDTPTPPRV